MTLRKRTFLIVGAVVAGLTGLLYLSARTVLLGGFARIEEETVPQEVVLVATVLAVGLAVSGLVLLLLERLVFRRLAALSSAVRGIGRGVDVKARIPAEGRDELAELGADINRMLMSLEQTHDQLRGRIIEVERFNRVAVRREHRIIELKRRINELTGQLGQNPPYRPPSGEEETSIERGAEEEMKRAMDPAAAGPCSPDESGPYDLTELLDVPRMQRLLDSFCAAVGVAAALIDLQGKVLVGARWQRICTGFHRVNPLTRDRCIESDTKLANRTSAGESFTIYQCRNGLTDAASPVRIGNRHVANVFVGQFLLQPPRPAVFRRQAAEFGFDEAAYLQALGEVPVVPQEKLPAILDFLVSFAELVAAMGLEHLQEKRIEAELARHAGELDSQNRALHQQRQAALNLAEDAEDAKIEAERSESALRKSEERYRAIADLAKDAIIACDATGRVELWNPAAERMFGYPAEEVIGRDMADLILPARYREAGSRGLAVFERLGEGPTVGGTLELTALRKDGGEFPIELSLAVNRGQKGLLAVAIVRDITDRKRADTEQTERLQRVQRQQVATRKAASHESVISGDFKQAVNTITELTAEVLQVSRAGMWLLSEDRQYLRCVDLYESEPGVHSVSQTLNAADYPRYFEALAGNRAIDASDARHDPRTSEFSARYLVPLGITSMLDAAVRIGGEVVGVLCMEHVGPPRTWHDDEAVFTAVMADQVAQVLTNGGRRRAEEELRESNLRLFRLNTQLDATAVELKTLIRGMLKDGNFAGRFANPLLRKCWEEMKCGRRTCPAYGNEANLRCWETAGTFCHGKVQGKFAQKLADCRECEVYQSARVNSVCDLGETFNDMIAILADRHAALEEARRAAEAASIAKSAFVANMSHEIRTPMTAILGYTDVLLEDGDSQQGLPDRTEAMLTIKRNGVYLLSILNDILDMSKIEAGKMTIERIPCSPCGIVAEVASLMRVRSDAKGLPLSIEYEGAIPEAIHTDPTRLRQILVNMIGNAIKFTDMGQVRLITRFSKDGKEPSIEFDVADTGVGMTEDEVGRLFRPFVQGDASTARRFGGTGLGLALSKRMAQMLGGDITVVESRPGVGTRFRVVVATGPLEGVRLVADPILATTVKNQPGRKFIQAPSPTLPSCRILLAEDGPDNQRLIAHVLKKAGAEVVIVENGQLAVDAAMIAQKERRGFDVILMDIQMPVMDGYAATRMLREKGYTSPIIALTAHAMASDRDKCIQAGCDDYATKPIDRHELLNTVSRHLCRKAEASLSR